MFSTEIVLFARRSPRVPPELTDQMISYLYDDEQALSACALACRQFLPKTRALRFMIVRVDGYGSSVFLKILAGDPNVARYVRKLKIVERIRGVFRPIQDWTNESLATFLAKFPKVDNLELEGLQVSVSMVDAIKTHLSNVRILRLAYCQLHGMLALRILYCFFPALQFLQLSSPCLREPPAPDAEGCFTVTVTELPKLSHLYFTSRHIGDIVMPEFLDWMISTKLHTNLRHLFITNVRDDDVNTLHTLLREIGPTLQKLAIGFVSDEWTDQGEPTPAVPQFIEQRILSHCTALEAFSLYDITVCRPHVHWVHRLLATLAAPRIQLVRIRLRHINTTDTDPTEAETDRYISHLDWARIGTVLSTETFASLKALRIRFDKCETLPVDLYNYFVASLQPLERRGVHIASD